MSYALNCADLQGCGGVLRCGSRGGAKGGCHTPLHIYLCNQQATYTVYMITQKPKLSAFPECPKNYIGHRKNYVLCRKNYIRHNPNYIRLNVSTLLHNRIAQRNIADYVFRKSQKQFSNCQNLLKAYFGHFCLFDFASDFLRNVNSRGYSP